MRTLSPLLLLVFFAALSACSAPAAGGLGAARTASEAGNYAAALVLADTAIARTPQDAEAYILRADIRRRMIAADEASVDSMAVSMALADAQRAAQIAPDNVNSQNVMTNLWITAMNRGATAFQQTPPDFRGARILFRTATLVRPDSAQSHVNYGLALYASGDPYGAIEPYRTAIRLEPTDAASYRRLGRALLGASQGTEAISVLEGAATRFPDDADISAELFAAYAATPGRAADALARYETALARATPATEPTLRLQYGIALLQARRVDDAVRELTRAAELSPTDATVQYNLGAAIQNKAATLSAAANAATSDSENARLIRERDAALVSSLPYFERARTLAPEGDDRRGACTALFRVYSTLGRNDEARAVSQCAGIPMN